MFSLRNRIQYVCQEDESITSYFNSLTRLWQELDLFQSHSWKDPDDAKVYCSILSKERIYDFLASLTPSLDDVRGRILGSKPLPCLDEIFAKVRREEHRKSVMLGPSSLPSSDSSTMLSRSMDDRSKKATTWCDYCHKPYHTKAKYWKLQGKPDDWIPKHVRHQESVGHTVSTKSDSLTPTSSFTHAQLDHLTKLMATSTSSTSLMAPLGNDTPSLVDASKSPWIIDSRASDHMIGSQHIFTSFVRCNASRSVKIVNGSSLNISSMGIVVLSPQLCLTNLLSISKFAADKKLTALFTSSTCQFQDQISGQVIGSAKEVHGLYYFLRDFSSKNKHQEAISSTTGLSLHQKLCFSITT